MAPSPPGPPFSGEVSGKDLDPVVGLQGPETPRPHPRPLRPSPGLPSTGLPLGEMEEEESSTRVHRNRHDDWKPATDREDLKPRQVLTPTPRVGGTGRPSPCVDGSFPESRGFSFHRVDGFQEHNGTGLGVPLHTDRGLGGYLLLLGPTPGTHSPNPLPDFRLRPEESLSGRSSTILLGFRVKEYSRRVHATNIVSRRPVVEIGKATKIIITTV